MPDTLVFIVIIFIWLVGLSLLFVYNQSVYKALTEGVDKKDIVSLLKSILKNQKTSKSELEQLKDEIKVYQTESKNHITKVGTVRFNPFDDMGGEHSFSLALLDSNDNGFIFTSLHTRERTRTYIKEVKTGKADQTLSKEEDKALKQAQEQKWTN